MLTNFRPIRREILTVFFSFNSDKLTVQFDEKLHIKRLKKNSRVCSRTMNIVISTQPIFFYFFVSLFFFSTVLRSLGSNPVSINKLLALKFLEDIKLERERKRRKEKEMRRNEITKKILDKVSTTNHFYGDSTRKA